MVECCPMFFSSSVISLPCPHILWAFSFNSSYLWITQIYGSFTNKYIFKSFHSWLKACFYWLLNLHGLLPADIHAILNMYMYKTYQLDKTTKWKSCSLNWGISWSLLLRKHFFASLWGKPYWFKYLTKQYLKMITLVT